MSAKFPLNFNCADCGVHLNLRVKLFVICCAQVVEELTGPGTAIATVGIEARIKTQCRTGDDRDQILAGFELLEFSVILNTGQFQPIDFLILDQQRFARWTKHGIPAEATKVCAMQPAHPMGRNVTMQPKCRNTDCAGQYKNENLALD